MGKNIDDLFGDLFSGSPITPGKPREYRPLDNPKDAMKQAEQMGDQMNRQLQEQMDAIKRMTAELDFDGIQREVEQDFGVTQAAQTPGKSETVGIDGFDLLIRPLSESILGQEAFLQRLIIAFKRPFVAGFPEEGAKNTVYIYGGKGTGKHSAVCRITELLKERQVFLSGNVQRMDLSVYPTQAEEKLFLQDLYMALQGEGEVVIFDKYQFCHPSLLGHLSDLVSKGKVRLNTRYVLQKGRLLDAGNALTADMVSAIGPNGKYLVFISENEPEQVAGSFGASFLNAIGDTCHTADFTPESLEAIAAAKLASLVEKASHKLDFTLVCGEDMAPLLATKHSPDAGAGGIEEYCDGIFKALTEYKLEQDIKALTLRLYNEDGRIMAQPLPEQKEDATTEPNVQPGVQANADPGAQQQAESEAAEDNLPEVEANQRPEAGKESEAKAELDAAAAGAFDLFALLPGEYQGELEAVKAEIDKIVGLEEIKQYIFSLESHYQVQKMRKEQGMKSAPVSMHMIFTGDPGTGKTTIARVVSKYLKAIGVLSGGQLIEVTRADLVGKYVGHTAPLTTQVLKSAIGGVLFIDEAYSLYRGDQDSFGLEAIDTLVKGMEDNRDNLLVVLAGYSKEMEVFLTANSGLRSRFPNIIEFPDYTGEQLREIANLQARAKGYEIEEEAQGPLLDYFTIIQAMDSRESGNGRLARNVVEKAILDQSRRIVVEQDALNVLRLGDFDLFEKPKE